MQEAHGCWSRLIRTVVGTAIKAREAVVAAAPAAAVGPLSNASSFIIIPVVLSARLPCRPSTVPLRLLFTHVVIAPWGPRLCIWIGPWTSHAPSTAVTASACYRLGAEVKGVALRLGCCLHSRSHSCVETLQPRPSRLYAAGGARNMHACQLVERLGRKGWCSPALGCCKEKPSHCRVEDLQPLSDHLHEVSVQ